MIARLCVMVLVVAAPLAAQTVSPGLEPANPEMRGADARAAVQARVVEFLRKLGGRDVEGVRALLAPKALIAVVRQRPDGTFVNSYQSRDEFMAQFEKNAGQPKFEEPISNVEVTIDSERLAHVRADFQVVREDRVLSSGIDHFTLVKEPDGWKIAVIAYTSLPASPAS